MTETSHFSQRVLMEDCNEIQICCAENKRIGSVAVELALNPRESRTRRPIVVGDASMIELAFPPRVSHSVHRSLFCAACRCVEVIMP
jgi:hypothetical protein